MPEVWRRRDCETQVTSLSALTFASSCVCLSVHSAISQKGLSGVLRLARGPGPLPSPKKWATIFSQKLRKESWNGSCQNQKTSSSPKLSFYRWGDRGPENRHDLLKVIQGVI